MQLVSTSHLYRGPIFLQAAAAAADPVVETVRLVAYYLNGWYSLLGIGASMGCNWFQPVARATLTQGAGVGPVVETGHWQCGIIIYLEYIRIRCLHGVQLVSTSRLKQGRVFFQAGAGSGPVVETGHWQCPGLAGLSTAISCGSEATEATCEPAAHQ